MTEYETHLTALIGLKRAGEPRNRAERRHKAGVMRDAARYCERARRLNPKSGVGGRMAAELAIAGRSR
jgi:hypothetical protein